MSGCAMQRAAARAGERVGLRQRAQHDQIRVTIQAVDQALQRGRTRCTPRRRRRLRVVAQLLAQELDGARSSRLPVGLFGVHRNTSFTPLAPCGEHRLRIEREAAFLEQRNFDDACALDARGHLVHAECRRADQRRCPARRDRTRAPAGRCLRRCRGRRARCRARHRTASRDAAISSAGCGSG